MAFQPFSSRRQKLGSDMFRDHSFANLVGPDKTVGMRQAAFFDGVFKKINNFVVADNHNDSLQSLFRLTGGSAEEAEKSVKSKVCKVVN